MFKAFSLILFLCLPALAHSQPLTDDEIDRYLEALPTAAPHLDGIKDRLLNGGNEDISEQLMKAGMKGKGTRTAIEIGADTPEIASLRTIAIDAGFGSLENWALVSDRISAVIFSAVWVANTDSLGNSESDVTGDTNIFEYIVDESKTQERRDEVRAQLEKLCNDSCYEPEDLSVVGARFDEIKTVFESIP